MVEKKLEITQDSINILLDPKSISQKNIWEIDIIKILESLINILNKSHDKDLKMAGIAALSSSLIHKMKVETIFALQKPVVKKTIRNKNKNTNIQILDIPYRHETTYPVTLNELLEVLGNLINSIVNPTTNKKKMELIEPVPEFNEYIISYEDVVKEYEKLILDNFQTNKTLFFNDIISKLKLKETIRCFLALLFLAKDKKVELEQTNDDIKISLK